jgi:hypothetical protein
VNSQDDYLTVKRYGTFVLTDAVRPGPNRPIVPREGYRMQIYRDRFAGLKIPMLCAAVSAEKVFDTFLALLEPLGEDLHCVLESSHGSRTDRHRDHRRSHVDAPILLSYFCEFEELLLNDGCTGVAVVKAGKKVEVQFDEHKQLYVYAKDLDPYRQILRDRGIRKHNDLQLLSEAEHLHHTTDDFAAEFQELCSRLGVGDFEGVPSDESGMEI